jgi:HEAT repeat protein
LKNKTEDKDVRMGSAVALGDIKDKKAVEPLIEVLKDNKEYVWLRVAAVSALGNMGDERALVPMREVLKDSSDYVRNAAQSALLKVRKN